MQVSGTETGVPASVVRETSAQCGAPVSVSVTVAGADSAVPSLAVNVKVSSPAASASGV